MAKPITIISVGSNETIQEHVFHRLEDLIVPADLERLAEERLDPVTVEEFR